MMEFSLQLMKLYMGMLGNNLINNGIKLFKNMNKSFFITGTDTHIGKTEITCGLIQFFQERGYLACGMKPVAAGTEIIDEHTINSDVHKFLSINSVRKPVTNINPYSFEQPIAPHIASNLSNQKILFPKIQENFLLLQKECEYLSYVPPGPYGTIIFSVLPPQSCAETVVGKTSKDAAARVTPSGIMRFEII